MSAYTTVQLEFNDPECIASVLTEMGYPFEVHNEAQTLYGVGHAARDQKAHIIVRQQHVGLSANDVGFLRKSDGTYEMIISEYDRRGSKKQAVDFMQRMKQLYGKYRVMKQAKKLGCHVISTKQNEDGKLKIKLRA